ncbi:hypothetical protein [Pseudomonas urmiensis]|uniref:hypothetical protein n=1 Tax=Pseudomonas urmiensis TaxID=2745493 RepID=UPI003C93F499
MTVSDTYIFKSIEGYLAWVEFYPGRAICYIPQLGSWYEETHIIDDVQAGLERARYCLEKSGVQVEGGGARMVLSPGQYYPRIWRGVYRFSFLSDSYDKLDPFEVYGPVYNQCIVAAESLLLEVKDVFRFVEPAQSNLTAYSHRLRELLILICTEIEACWSGVLKANIMEQQCDRFTTKNYLKVCTPLRLTEWEVKLKDYDLKFEPFKRWNILQPTKSLPWYDDYNSVKHDREGNFSRSTLGNVLNAAAALHVLQVAQFGPGIYEMWRGNRFSIFDVCKSPAIELSEIYLSKPIIKGKFDSPVELRSQRV